MVIIEVFLHGPEVVIVQSAAELDPDPLLHVPVFPGGNLEGSDTVDLPLSILGLHPEQLELDGSEDAAADDLEVNDELREARVVSELAWVSFREDLVLGEALDKDVSSSIPGDGGIVVNGSSQSINIIQEVGEFIFEGNGFLEGSVIDTRGVGLVLCRRLGLKWRRRLRYWRLVLIWDTGVRGGFMQRKEVGRIFSFLGFEEQFGEEISEVLLIHSVTRKQGKSGERSRKELSPLLIVDSSGIKSLKRAGARGGVLTPLYISFYYLINFSYKT